MSQNPNASAIGRFVSELQGAKLPANVMDAAKQSLIDWFAVCAAASADREAGLVADTMMAWRSQGEAVSIGGRTGSAGPVALINATYSHALDFDDFHIASIHHAGGPTFAATLAMAMDRHLSGEAVLRAFVAGFEVGTRVGMNDLGLTLGNGGWHPTCILGHISAAIGCAALLGLDQGKIERALGFAAGQAGGLMASAGTIAKPFLVGKSAFSGVLAAELAERGASVPGHLIDAPVGIFGCLLQKEATLDLSRLGVEWEVTNNTFKPYSACQLTHASIDAARLAAARTAPDAIKSVRAFVNPFALKIAGNEKPATSLQAKFSLKHVVAMALRGHGASPGDFTAETVADPRIVGLRDRIEIVPTDDVARVASRLEITLRDGSTIVEFVPAAKGCLEQPMTMADTERKFLDSAGDAFGGKSQAMLDALKHFDDKGAIEEVAALLKGRAA